MVDGIIREAVLSEDGMYRYFLSRELNVDYLGLTYAFFGVNPSTADAMIDDSTVKKWLGFCSRWGAQKFLVGNVFAYRATDVKKLLTAPNPIGVSNHSYQDDIIEQADILVPCWGNKSKMPKPLRWHAHALMDRLFQSGKPVMCFGKTKSGDPMHPLMLGYDTKLEMV